MEEAFGKEPAKQIVANLKKKIRERGFKFKQIADAIGYSQQRLHYKLNSQSPMTLADLFLICKAAGIHPAELFPSESFLENLRPLSLVDFFGAMIKREVREVIGGKNIVMRVSDEP